MGLGCAGLFAAAAILTPSLALTDPATFPLTRIEDVRRLSPQKAAEGVPVRLEAVVTYYHHDWEMLFVQDATGAIFIYVDHRRPPFPLHLGQRVLVEGKTVAGDFVASIAAGAQVTPLGEAGLPTAYRAPLKETATGVLDARWVEVRGVVRSASVVDGLLLLTLTMDGGKLRIHVKDWDEKRDPAPFVDSVVRVRGVCTTLVNDRHQFLGAEVWSPDISQLEVETPALEDPFAVPALSIDDVRRYAFGGGHDHRLKISATVTFQQPGRGLFVQDDRDALFVQAPQAMALAPGQRVDALGFVALKDDRVVFEDASVRRAGRDAPIAPIAPIPVTVATALADGEDSRLVRLTGRFVGRIATAGEEALVFEDGHVVFNARLPPGMPEATLAALDAGSLVQLTGVLARRASEGRGPRSLEILLRSATDLAVLEKPSWWTADRVRGGLGIMSGVFVLALGWVALLRRRVQYQTGIIRERLEHEAALERESAEELRKKDEALRESQQRFALAVQGTNDGVWDWDLRKDRLYFSPRWKSMLGYSEGEIGDTSADWFALVHPEDQDRLKAKLEQHRQGETSQFEDEHRMRQGKDGTYRWVLSRGFASRDEAGTAYRMTGAQTDVTDRRSYDPLTELPNRALFVERLERAMARAIVGGHRFGVLFLDLDRFKFVNDSLGHLAGDRLLITFARRLEVCVRPGDMVARFGGDEFAILIDGIVGPTDAATVAERIQRALAQPIDLGGHEVYTSASIGIALSTNDVREGDDLLRDADTAMYRAKAAGRARFEVFDAAMREEVTVFMKTESDLRRALEREELRVHYQPIVSLETGAVVAMEALLRWEHPERGLLAPEAFMKVAEETGLIVPIGQWTLRRACQNASTWRGRDGTRPVVCVNLSARELAASDLVAHVREALAGAALAANRLVLEVTESSLLDTAGDVVQRMEELKALGVRVHLDDFGTGYSSLSYLYRLPIDALKIDRSFVAAMGVSEDAYAIVRTIVTLAHNLHLGVVAEGIESEVQLERLREMGCDQGQGYFFSMAVEPAMAAAVTAGGPMAPRRRTGAA
jgi:diguanylate cyclase (GGDEF)-like protein/PAS domain S-box-containing protein